MTRAERVAAALSAWRIETEPGDAMPSMASVKAAGDALAALLREPQPEPAAVGSEDVELIRVARGAALSPVIERPVRNLLEDLATRLETALDDVARLERAIASWKVEEAVWFRRQKALMATLAAVRRIAESYHDVDVVGDPPHEVACNPCANEILNALDARAGRNDAG